jgi:hypothetical protein
MNSPHGAPPSTPNVLGDHVCPELRTKTMYLTVDWRRTPDAEGSSTAIFWCLKTHLPLGPDDLPANAGDCRAGRGCCTLPRIEV